MHDTDPLPLYVPAEHGVQVDCPLPLYVPAGQELQLNCPVLLWNEPGAQAVHDTAPLLL